MRIWFDLSNSPHINMFYNLIRELEREGHTVVITSRPLANTVELLDQKGLKHTVVGEHYGKNFLKKILGYPVRVLQLRQFLKDKKIDLAVSQSSFHSPMVARLLNLPSIYTNDNEHALGKLISFYCATRILIPENWPVQKVVRKGIPAAKVAQYPGIKEGIYLWSQGEEIHAMRRRKPAGTGAIYIRPEPQTAQYYNGKHNFLDDVILALQDVYTITVLPRDANQAKHYRQEKFHAVVVPEKPLNFHAIAADCSIFIGAGGSMTRELAILGIPTISVYQDELLDVDKFLIARGLMLHKPALTPADVQDYAARLENKSPELELMNKGKAAYQLLKSEILRFGQAVN